MEHLTSKHTDPVQNGTPGHPQLESATNITKKKVFVWWDTIMCIHPDKLMNMAPWNGTHTLLDMWKVHELHVYM
jgi:hypothetical protein